MRITSHLYHLSEDDLWLHGAAASLAVKAILKETRSRKIPQASTIAALIHDIGKLIMVRHLKADVASIQAKCTENNLTFVEAEKELFGCDHAEVGGAMARKWSFPEPITDAIEQHHATSPEEPSLMLDAVMQANLIAKTIGFGIGADGMNLSVDPPGCKERMGLTTEGFERVRAQTAAWVVDLKSSYGLRN